MRQQDLRPFLVEAIGEITIAGLTLGLVLGTSRFIRSYLNSGGIGTCPDRTCEKWGHEGVVATRYCRSHL